MCGKLLSVLQKLRFNNQNMREAFPEMLIGAGTVLTTAQVDEAIDAGVDFIVSLVSTNNG